MTSHSETLYFTFMVAIDAISFMHPVGETCLTKIRNVVIILFNCLCLINSCMKTDMILSGTLKEMLVDSYSYLICWTSCQSI